MISHVRANQALAHTARAAKSEAPQASAAAAETAAAPADSAQISGFSNQLQSLLAATATEAKSLEQKLAKEPHEEGEVIVRLKGGFSLEAQDNFVDKFGATVIHKFDIPRDIYKSFDGELLQLKLPHGMNVAQAMAAMAKDGQVDYVVPNHTYQLEAPVEGSGQLGSANQPQEGAQNVPNDLVSGLWGLNNTGQDGGTADADIDAPEAWTVNTGAGTASNGPVIAVIDTGIDYNHPDLAANMWTNPGEIPGDGIDNDGNGIVDDVYGYNAYADNGNPLDGHSHGTHCSGTIAAKGNNEQGVVGVNWDARLMAVKIFNDQGSTNAAAIVRGILYATANGARLTSNSWGGGAPNQAIRDAFAESPALHMMAAGNSGTDNDSSPHYPSSYDLPNIVAVAASDRNDQRASFSCYGAESVDIAAPGKDILSTLPNNQYGSYSGTSMATPHVAGAAGLIASNYPGISNEELKSRLMTGADKLPQWQGLVSSGGRLNVNNSLENDSLAPGAPNDFSADSATTRSVSLSWTATGDDGWCGEASSYQVRVSDRPIVDGEAGQGQISFDQATPVEVARPSATGTIEEATINLTPSGSERQLYFALKVLDNVGNASEIRSASATVPAASLAFEDSIDGGADNWTADEGWGQVEEAGRGKVWTDSPGGDYGNNANSKLTTRPISLEHYTNSSLMFEAKYDMETRYDNVHVEVSGDGENWAELAKFTGSSDWAGHSLDLSAFDGQNVQLRFRVTSDGSVTKDGFSLDNVVIAGDYNPPPPPPPQQPPQQG